MSAEEYDRVIFDIVASIWEAYRVSTKNKNAAQFNQVFKDLYIKYDKDLFTHVIRYMGLALAPSINFIVSGEEYV